MQQFDTFPFLVEHVHAGILVVYKTTHCPTQATRSLMEVKCNLRGGGGGGGGEGWREWGEALKSVKEDKIL